MKVEVLIAYGNFRKGDVIPDMPGNVARSMIGRNMVREIKEEAPAAPVAAAVSAPMNRMLPLPGREQTNAPRHARRR